MYGTGPARAFDGRTKSGIAALTRPVVVSLGLLAAGILTPLPVRSAQGVAAHLLGIPTLCPFRSLTGIPCPGCGMTRSFVCVCHGRIWEAVSVYHPGGPILVAACVVTAAYGLVTRQKLPDRFVTLSGYCGVLLLTLIWLARLLHWLPWPPE